MGVVHSQRISDTPRALARETLVHHQCQEGTAICAAGGGGQTEGEGGSPPSTENRSSHSQKLFWKQQFEAAVKSNPKQMRWHPLMIKWCLKSSTTYKTLYNSGLLKLPSQRTLRDYTHVIKPSSGFLNDIDDMIVKEAKLGELEEWQKHVVLIFDEMHIKEDLIFDKLTDELKGFINLTTVLQRS